MTSEEEMNKFIEPNLTKILEEQAKTEAEKVQNPVMESENSSR